MKHTNLHQPFDEKDPIWDRLHDEHEPMWVIRSAAIAHQAELNRMPMWKRLIHRWFFSRYCIPCRDWEERP